MPEVSTIQKTNQKILKKVPKDVPSKENPLSMSLESLNIIPQGASDRPKVQIAISAFLRFAFHSVILDIFIIIEEKHRQIRGSADVKFEY